MTTTTNLNDLPLPDLYTALTADSATQRLFEIARDEDLGPDRTDATTDAMAIGDQTIRAAVVAREQCTIAGLAAVEQLAALFAPNAACSLLIEDGAAVDASTDLATIEGPAGEVLALERTLLNLLGRLSGIATLTSEFVNAVSDTNASVLDTRKTTPGWRALEKYAVRCGGGHCHRIGLYDAVLIKDNHLALASGTDLTRTLTDAARNAKANPGIAFVEVEVDTLEQFKQVLTIEPGLIDIVLLDNMTTDELRTAVAERDAHAPRILLEASGGVSLETIAAIAATGVDRISSGALTHQAVSVDIALDAR